MPSLKKFAENENKNIQENHPINIHNRIVSGFDIQTPNQEYEYEENVI